MKICGIYCIKNTATGKVYVGSSVNIHARWKTHQSSLRLKKHHSPYLQRAWDKYGADCFEWTVLQEVDPSILHDIETAYMKLLRSAEPEHGYNQAPVGGSCLGFRHNQETKKRMSEAQKKIPYEHRITYCRSWVGKSHTDETKAKMSANSKRVSPSAEQRAAISKVHKGKVISAEHRAIVGRATAEKNKTPEMRAKVSAALKGRVFTPEWREKLRQAAKRRWAKTQEIIPTSQR